VNTIIVLLAIAASPPGADPADSPASTASPPPRTLHAIHQDMRTAFRDQVRARTDPERAAAIYRMTELYQEIRHHPNAELSPTLKEYKARLWSRLKLAQRDIELQIKRDLRNGTAADPSQLDVQQTQRAELLAASLAEHMDVVGSTLGGPSRLIAPPSTARGGGTVPDYGPALVALIERTIAPEFWDTHGGPGTIVYYKPLMVLVVRATSEVHHTIGGTLGGLRAAK
jgi:hypothetical protein